jgi:hypothetical protein
VDEWESGVVGVKEMLGLRVDGAVVVAIVGGNCSGSGGNGVVGALTRSQQQGKLQFYSRIGG